mmetsp:Transcript_22164/g.69352  ORF Transcript_22164/g.69352 Transcript_22164/m.69352 type:complete len:265 (-) Transcript_22164:318-1112(-)
MAAPRPSRSSGVGPKETPAERGGAWRGSVAESRVVAASGRRRRSSSESSRTDSSRGREDDGFGGFRRSQTLAGPAGAKWSSLMDWAMGLEAGGSSWAWWRTGSRGLRRTKRAVRRLAVRLAARAAASRRTTERRCLASGVDMPTKGSASQEVDMARKATKKSPATRSGATRHSASLRPAAAAAAAIEVAETGGREGGLERTRATRASRLGSGWGLSSPAGAGAGRSSSGGGRGGAMRSRRPRSARAALRSSSQEEVRSSSAVPS